MTESLGLSPEVVSALGWALVHSLWQGALAAALAAGLLPFLRKASARYLLALGALVVTLLAPVVTVTLWPGAAMIEATAQRAAAGPAAPEWAGEDAAAPAALTLRSGVPARGAFELPPAAELFPALVFLWLIGVTAFSLRAAGGLLVVGRIRRRGSVAVRGALAETCRILLGRLGIRRPVRFELCDWLDAPAVIGWFRPVVFLPMTALTGLSQEQLRLVIAHELAHVRRWDPFVNLFQVITEALLFYHPAVWWLNRRVRAEREHCCDDAALSLSPDPLEYARALTKMAEGRRSPAMAMAANHGPLAARVARILGAGATERKSWGGGLLAGALALAAAALVGQALANSPPYAPAPAGPGESSPFPSSPAAEPSGWGPWTAEQQLTLDLHGITEGYFRALEAQGVAPRFGELVALRIHGATPEYLRDLRRQGLAVTSEQLVALAVHGVHRDLVRNLEERGLVFDADQLIAMKVHGVTPAYVDQLREAGLEPTSDQVIALKVHGVTPAYVAGLAEAGLRPSADDVLGLRVHGVSLGEVRAQRRRGQAPDADGLIASKLRRGFAGRGGTDR